jgi:flagellar protein FliL
VLNINMTSSSKIGVALSLWLTATMAGASGGGETFAPGVNYLPLRPPLIVNYGGVGKVKFIKAEISIRVEDNQSAVEVTHHMPLIRDTLIMLLSTMNDEQMSNGEGKERMRQQALAKVNEMLELEINKGHAAAGAKKPEHSNAKEGHGDDGHSKDKSAKGEHAKAGAGHAAGGPVSDLFFDNLVVQK